MFFSIELLILVLMLAAVCVLTKVLKLPAGISLMITSILGMLLGTIFSHTDFSIRFLFDGAFDYFEFIPAISFATFLFGAMKATGALDYLCAKLVKLLGKIPALLILALAFIVMLPGIVTGSALVSVITTGPIVKEILTKWGVSKKKAGAFVVAEAIMGELCPPVSITAMMLCRNIDSCDVPYNTATLPLLLMVIPCAIAVALILVREYVKPINKENASEVVDLSIENELNITCLIPLFAIILFIILEIIFPKYLGMFGITLALGFATILAFIFGKKLKFFNGFDDKDTVVGSLVENTKALLPILALLMGTGMFVNVMALNGTRGYIITNLYFVPKIVKIILALVLIPLIGGFTPYGSVTVMGVAFIMVLYQGQAYNPAILACAFSLLASLGHFLLPSKSAIEYVEDEENKWCGVTLASLPAICIMVLTSALYAFVIAKMLQGGSSFDALITKTGDLFYVIVMGVFVVIDAVILTAYFVVKKLLNKKKGLGE